MRLRSLEERLTRLERGDDTTDARLQFENGSRAALRVRDAVDLVCTAMRNEYARLQGQEPEASKHAAKLALMRRAERIETNDGLLAMAFDVTRGGAE